MSDRFLVSGGARLSGEVAVTGAKNSVLKLMAAALLADVDTLYSEDMHDGLLVEGRLRIRNPFRARSVQDTP